MNLKKMLFPVKLQFFECILLIVFYLLSYYECLVAVRFTPASSVICGIATIMIAWNICVECNKSKSIRLFLFGVNLAYFLLFGLWAYRIFIITEVICYHSIFPGTFRRFSKC